MKTFYDVLNVSEDASIEEIINAYQELKNKYESYLLVPERKEKAEEMIKKLEVAYKVLSNEETKSSYDKDLVNMRNNELINKLQKNTSDYNREIEKKEIEQKQDELERQQKQKIEEEALNKKRIEIVQNTIEKQIKEQKKQLEIEKQAKKMMQDAINKEYKKSIRKQKLNTIIRKFIAVVVVFAIVFLLSRIPFIKNFYIERINFLRNLF